MIIGNENIITWFKAQKRPSWRLKKSSNSDVIAYSQTDDPSLDEGLQELKETFNYIAPGQYFLECWKHGDKKNWARCPVQIDGASGENLPANVTGIYSPEDIETRINDGIEKYKRNQEYEEMKAELQELRAKDESLQNKVLGRLEPYLPMIGDLLIKQLGGNAAGIGTTEQKKKVNNNPENQNQMEDQELIERANVALTKWFGLDNDAVEILEKIAQLAENDPKMYELAKKTLNDM